MSTVTITFSTCGLGVVGGLVLALLALAFSFVAWLIGYLNPGEPKLATAFLIAAVLSAVLATVLLKGWPQC